ncbi:MAG: hypothetical protein FJ387_02940 [Verrucomicrobia bacterium]|nr:hypothetical protein [Verrucomicrobiota bacterium]
MNEPWTTLAPSSDSSGARPRTRRVRWWPAVLVLALAGLAVAYFRSVPEYSHQQHNLHTMLVGLAAAVALLLWILLFSRLRWTVRWSIVGGALGATAVAAVLFEIRGVTGDLLPILRFRWQRPAPLPAQAPPPNASSPAPLAAASLSAASGWPRSFPQFLGPDRNAMLPSGPSLERDWTTHPPTRLWRQPIGAAWSAFAVADGRAVTQEQDGDAERVVCYELLTGRVLWAHSDEARYDTTLGGVGPRATPTIAGDRVVTLGATGILNCFALATGRRHWTKDIVADNEARLNEWGMAGSPLVLNELVMVNPGGDNGRSLVAYRLDDGGFVWGDGDGRASYSSPFATDLGGVPQVLIFNQRAILGHDPATGRVLWQHPWPSSHPHAALPLALDGDRVLLSAGYGVGSQLLQVRQENGGGFLVNLLFKTIRLKSKFNNLVTRNGFVYGLDDGILACLDAATGELMWKEGRYGHGQFLLVRDLLLITAENGEVILLDPVPIGRRELSRFAALTGKTWNPPALAGDLLLVRNDREAACYRLPLAP